MRVYFQEKGRGGSGGGEEMDLLPPIITDQLMLWQNERYRLHIIPPVSLSSSASGGGGGASAGDGSAGGMTRSVYFDTQPDPTQSLDQTQSQSQTQTQDTPTTTAVTETDPHQHVYLYTDFPNQRVFEKVLAYARRLKVLLWCGSGSRSGGLGGGGGGPFRLCILEEGHVAMRDYVKRILSGLE